MWLYPIPAIIAVVGFLYVLFMRQNFQKEVKYAIVLIIIGLIIYFVRSYTRKEFPFGSMLLAMRLNKKVILCLLLCVFASLRGVFPSYAQVRPVNDYGALGLAQLLKRLNTTASVMMIGAHPDDEDSALIAYLARGESARTAYLSLTRGDGGQNIIGPESFSRRSSHRRTFAGKASRRSRTVLYTCLRLRLFKNAR